MTTALMPFEPTTLTEAMELSRTIASASLIPAALRDKPADVLISIMAGRELGLSPMQSLRSMHVVQGRPVMSADLMVALCVKATDVCEYFQLVESSAVVATYETKRKGHRSPTRMSFTIAQAKTAGLTGKDNWRNYPDAMLRARAAAALARTVYPDLLAGVYESSELGEARQPLGVVPEPEPVDVTPAKQPEPEPPVEAAPAKEEAPHVTAAAAPPADIIASLTAQIEAATTEDGLTAAGKEVGEAHKAGKITDADRSALLKIYIAKQAAIRGQRAA